MVIRSPPDQRRPGGGQQTQARASASRWTHGEPVDSAGRRLRRGDKGANSLVKSSEAGGRSDQGLSTYCSGKELPAWTVPEMSGMGSRKPGSEKSIAV